MSLCLFWLWRTRTSRRKYMYSHYKRRGRHL